MAVRTDGSCGPRIGVSDVVTPENRHHRASLDAIDCGELPLEGTSSVAIDELSLLLSRQADLPLLRSGSASVSRSGPDLQLRVPQEIEQLGTGVR